MIYIKMFQKDNLFFGIECKGHADYDSLGKDIVCAGVSVLTQSIFIGLTEVINSDFDYKINDKKAYLYLNVSKYNDSDMKKAQILFLTFMYSIESLILSYDKYICLNIVEEN